MPAHPRWRGMVLPLAILLAGEIALRASGIRSDGVALPSDVAVAAVVGLGDGSILRETGNTLIPAASGLAIGGGLGLLTGLWFGLSAAAARLASLSVELFRPIPPV